MKKLSKKLFALLMAMVLCLGLCACGGSEKSGSSDDDDVVEIALWYTSGSLSQAYLEDLIDGFNESQEEYWVVVYNNGDPATIRTKLETTSNKEDYPDVFLGQATATCYYSDMDYVKPVQDFLDTEETDWTTDIYPNVKKTYTDTEGNMIGYPLGVSTSGYYVNVDAIEEAGYSLEDLTSYEKIAEVAKTTVSKGICDYGLSTLGTGVELMDMLTLQGVHYVDNNNGYDGEITKSLLMEGETYEAYKKAASIYADLAKEEVVMVAGSDVSAECWPMFNSGDLAMLYATNSWTHYVIDGAPEFEYAFIPSVGVDENAKYKGCAISEGTGLYIANTGNEKKMQGAYEFIKYMAEPANQSTYCQLLGYVPYTEEAFNDAEYQAWMAEYLPSAQGIADKINAAPEELRTPYIDVFDEMLSVTNTLYNELSADPTGNLESAMKKAAKVFSDGIQDWLDRQ